MDAMASNFVRLTVVADDNQLDVSLPAHRPIAEYIDDVVELLGPASAAPAASWTLSSVRHGVLDLEDTLSDHSLTDGAQLHLTRSAEAMAPPFVDDVIDELRRQVAAGYQRWAPETARSWIASAVAVILIVGGGSVVAVDDTAAAVGALSGLAVFAAIVGALARRSALGHVLWAAVPLAAAAAWRAADSWGLAESVAFAGAAGTALAAVAAAVVVRSVSIAVANAVCAIVFGVAGVLFYLGANPTAVTVWGSAVPVVIILFAPAVALSSSGLLAQIRLSEQMELAARSAITDAMSRGRAAADVMVWTASALVVPIVATIALTGVWQQGLAAAFLVVIWLLRSRNFTHTRHVGPMILAAAAATAFLAVGVAGWSGLAVGPAAALGAGAAALVALCFGAGALPALPEVSGARVRRILDALDLPLAIAFIPVVFFAQGVYNLVWP